MEFNDLTYYGVLAQELNFHRAAARLGISQPSLTRRIRRLEREIGAYLLERHSGGIRLTAAGEIFAERAASIADEIARLMTEIADAGRGVLGRLAVGFLTSLSSDVFGRVLRAFASYRDLRLELREGTAHQQLVALRQQKIDLALTFGPINDVKLNTESLWRERLTAVAPAGHSIAVGRPLTWPALVDERLILRASEHDHSVADYVCSLAAAAGCRPLITEFLTTRENMVGLVRAGFGIALLPESSLLSLNTDQLVCIPMTGPGTEMEIVGVWLPENANPALRRFLEQVTLAVEETRDLKNSLLVVADSPTTIASEIPDPSG
jgi:DNA-binding transcriptional LysR family regulator